MYTMTLEINQKCNLNCKYCYLGEKNGAMMSEGIALKSIDYAFDKAIQHKDKKLWFDFVGGEALLDFSMIQTLVKYIEEKNSSFDYNLIYSVTTNATVFTEAIISFFEKYKFSLKVSIDGRKEVNDENRVAYAGYSVHDEILKNLWMVKSYEQRTGKLVQVSNVITNNNYMHFYDTLRYLTEELGFKVIDTAIDSETVWSRSEIETINEQIEKSLQYFFECFDAGKAFMWNYIIKLNNVNCEHKWFYKCGAGIVSTYIRTDGRIFACPGNLNDNVALGHVDTDIDPEKYRFLKNIKGIENKECQLCELNGKCSAQSCIMQSMAKNGRHDVPDSTMCRMEKFLFDLYKRNKERIDALHLER